MKKKILITVVIAVVFLGTAVVFAVNNNKNDEKTSKSEVVKTESPKEDANKVETSPEPEAPIATTQRSVSQSQSQATEPEPQPEVVKPSMSIAVAGTRLYVTPIAGTHPIYSVSIEFNGQVQNGTVAGDGIPVQFALPGGPGVANVTVTDTVGNSTTQAHQIN